MDIKLRTRLSAYSKVESINQVAEATVTNEAIDSFFNNDLYHVVNKAEIDGLFINEEVDKVVDKSDIDTLFTAEDNTRRISYAEIDSLFN